MTQFENPTPQFSTSRRAIDRPRIGRIGINQSLSAPGLAVSDPDMSGARLASQLNQALGGVGSIISDLGDSANRERIAELRAFKEAEREYKADLAEQKRDQREQVSAQRLLDMEDRRAAGEAAQIFSIQFENDVKTGTIQLGPDDDVSEFIKGNIAQATAGQSEEFSNAFTRLYYPSALRAINTQQREIRTKAYGETIKRAASTALTMADQESLIALVEDNHALDKTVPITEVAANILLPAATQAAESGDSKRTNMILGVLKDENFAIPKQIIQNKLKAAEVEIKSRNQARVTNSISRKLADDSVPISTIRQELKLYAGQVDGQELLQLTNLIDTVENKRLKESDEQVKKAQIKAFTTQVKDKAVAAFSGGEGYTLDDVGGENDLPKISRAQQEDMAARQIKQDLAAKYPDKPAEAFKLYIASMSKNGYKDPLISGFLEGGRGFLSQALIADDPKDSIKQIAARHQQYKEVFAVNPSYARSLAGEAADLYEAIDAVDSLFPASNIPVAIEHIARNRKENVSVSFSTTEQQSIQSAAQSVTAPWLTSNAQNSSDIAAKMEQLTRGYVLMGAPFSSAVKSAKARIADSHSIINGWMIDTQDVRMTPMVKRNLTDLMMEKFNAYKTKHGRTLQSLGLDDPDLWTMDYSPDTGYFSIVGKNPGDVLPVVDPELTVIDIDTVVRESARLDNKRIIREQQERANKRAQYPPPQPLIFNKQ